MRLLNCILCLLELFCFTNQTTQNNLQIYYENETITNPDCQILEKGFYIILTKNDSLSSSIIGGYHLVQKKDSFDYHHFIHSDLFPINSENSFKKQINILNSNSNSKIHYLTVDSSAVYVPSIGEEHISLFGISLEASTPSLLLGENIETNMCDPIPLQKIKEKFSAINENGENISDQITFISNYKEENVSLGKYYILAKIVLSYKSILIIKKIEVKDFDAPTIQINKDKITLQYGTKISSEEIISENTTLVDSSSTHIVIEKDTYQNAQVLGTYEILFHAVDDYQNSSETKKIIVELKDEIAPEITLKNDTQKIVSNTLLSKDELIDFFIIKDNYDMDLKATILEMKAISSTQYELTLSAIDSSGNEAIKSFPYYVIEESLPIVHIKNAIHIQNPEGYTNQELLPMIQRNAIYNLKDDYPYLHLIDAAHPISLSDLQNRYQIEDELDHTTIPFELDSNYIESSIGVYQVNIIFENALHQKMILKDLLWVRDFESPVVTCTETEIQLDLCQEWNEETFSPFFQIEDNLDTQLDFQIIGLEQLIQEGDYLIGCVAIDSSMNQSNKANILVHAYQSIHKTILPLTLDLDTNDLTEQELISLFLSKQEIKKGYHSLLIKTNYYRNQDGIYPTIIETSFDDGTKNLYIFKIKLKTNPKGKEKPLYIYISFSMIGILILVCLIVFIKRSNWLKNEC